MIISRTPLRISLGGGGTDLPSYYSRFGGFFISAAIDRYIYIALHSTFRKSYLVKYSKLEEVETIEEILHPIVREAFAAFRLEPFVEMVSVADIPAGTGLGSSGAFAVGLLKALHEKRRNNLPPESLAEQACHIEMDLLNEPVGKQDHYIAAFGGLTCFEVDTDGRVTATPLRISAETLRDLEDNLLLFFTGYSRNASEVLADQKQRSEKGDEEMLRNLHFIKQIGLSTRTALEAGDCKEFGRLMHEHWLQKKRRSPGISTDRINQCYELGRDSGAIGGKLIGAGGGGFLLFYTRDPASLRRAMSKAGLVEVRVAFDFEGSKIMADQ